MKENKKENVCERNFDGRFSGELCWEIVQQFTSEGPMNCFGGLSNIFASEGCKTRENSNFLKNGKRVISVKI